jgi:pilus assembly protein Flp/PilA
VRLLVQARLAALHCDRRGVVSFEYILVAACVIGSVAAALGSGNGGCIHDALAAGIAAIAAVINANT